MENIVRLAEYRKRQKQARKGCASSLRPAADLAAQYFCTRCDADEFKLSAAGMVHCAHCGAVMRNLLVGPPPTPAA